MSRNLIDLTNKELIDYFVFVLRETVKDEHERELLNNRFGFNLRMEDVFADMDKVKREIEQFLKECSENNETIKVSNLLGEFDEKFKWDQLKGWVFVNDKGKSQVRNWLVDAFLRLKGLK